MFKKYEPVQGTNSKKRAEKYLEAHIEEYNSDARICPIIVEKCLGDQCVAWNSAEVYLSNPGRVHEKNSVYCIRAGHCKNPNIIGARVI
jgi:hypothetical protein